MGCVKRRLLCVLTLAGVAWAVAGCSSSGSSVSGQVMIGGKPVAGGQVSFVAKTGVAYTSKIDTEGRYSIDAVPLGEMIVLVIGRPPPAATPVGQSGAAKKLSSANNPAAVTAPKGQVPEKYADPGTSDLRYTVVAGANTYDPPLN